LSDQPSSDSRRKFLKGSFVGISALTFAGQLPALAKSRQEEEAAKRFFAEPENSFLEIAVDRIIPPDERWPGAREAGVVEYIDRQMAGPWGRGELVYRHGPFYEGTAAQGYQFEYTPAELFRRSMNAINNHFASQGTPFDKLSDADKDAYLASLEKGGIDLDGVDSAVFFDQLLGMTVQGFFADPMYGGNRNMAGWRMIGFPGAYADYYDLVDKHGIEFKREPLSIADRDHPDSSLHKMKMRRA
jgi:gluconate 2-dehydrogenase gamma chain